MKPTECLRNKSASGRWIRRNIQRQKDEVERRKWNEFYFPSLD